MYPPTHPPTSAPLASTPTLAPTPVHPTPSSPARLLKHRCTHACFPAVVDKVILPPPPCPRLLQAMRASPLAWQRLLAWPCWLIWLVVCGLLVQLFCWAGLPPYTASTKITAMTAWLMCLAQGVLLCTHVITSIPTYIFYIEAALVAAALLYLKDDVAARRADIGLLTAMQAEAERRGEQLPEDLRELRRVVANFGTTTAAAVALATRALNAVNGPIRGVNWFLWKLV